MAVDHGEGRNQVKDRCEWHYLFKIVYVYYKSSGESLTTNTVG